MNNNNETAHYHYCDLSKIIHRFQRKARNKRPVHLGFVDRSLSKIDCDDDKFFLTEMFLLNNCLRKQKNDRSIDQVFFDPGESVLEFKMICRPYT